MKDLHVWKPDTWIVLLLHLMIFGILLFTPLVRSLALWGAGHHCGRGWNDVMASSSESESFMESHSFLFVSSTGAMVGGFAARSRTMYINRSGLIQESEVETNGDLHWLHFRNGAEPSDFERAVGSVVLPLREGSKREKRGPVEVSEYYAPETVVMGLLPSGKHFYEAFESNDLPPLVGRIVQEVATCLSRAPMESAKAGIYVRAQRLMDRERRYRKMDHSLTPGDLNLDERLRVLFQNEMGLVLVGKEGKSIVLAGRVPLKPGAPVHVECGDLAYVLFPYRLAAKSLH
jgi:hypothetical protein